MDILDRVVLGTLAGISVTTRDPTQSARPARDADALPTYSVYESFSDTPMPGFDDLEMPKHDDPGTTGVYKATFYASTSNGFEIGKSYTVIVTATVNGVSDNVSSIFRVVSTDDVDAEEESGGTLPLEIGIAATPAAGAQDMCCRPTTLRIPVLDAIPWADQNVITSEATTIDGRPLLSKTPCYRISGAQVATIQHQLVDRDGNPIDLSALCESSSSSSSAVLAEDCPLQLKLRLREYISLGRSSPPPGVVTSVTIIDEEEGIVRATLEKPKTTVPGVYFGELALVGEDDDDGEYVYFANTFYVFIERGHLSRRGRRGPPSIAEVRMHLRDTDPEESFLLDNLAFTDAEIAAAAVDCVEYWNEVPPPIDTYTTQTFPFRFHWLEGICGRLFLQAGELHRRNELKYNAAGVSVDDMSKEGPYEQAASRRWREFTAWVKSKKVSMNIDGAYAGHGSPYGRMW